MTISAIANQPHAVLLVEDNPSDAKLVKHALAKVVDGRYCVEHVTQLSAAVERVKRGGIDVALVDLSLPDSSGLETFQALSAAAPSLPIVVVTGLDDEYLAIGLLQHGAQDYLLKHDIEPKLLARSIRYAIERSRATALESLNQQLQQAKSSLTEAQVILENRNKRLTRLYRTAHKFVDNVSHEFRTPLTVIKEYVSLIKDGIVGGVSNEQRQMLTIVEDRADDLNIMVDDMLDVSKLEAGLLGVYRKQCKTTDIVAHVRTALERKAAVKCVQLEWDIDVDLPSLYCDPEKAGRVLINLTINAIKFCGQPGHVRLSCRKDQDLPGVEFSVTDNGPGISAENQQALFRRFKQLSESVRSSTKGFGLGLSIAKELAEANLGEIRVDSEPGQGSTFSFTLPPADSTEVMRRYLHRVGQLRNGPPYLSLVQTDIAESATSGLAEDVDGLLSCLLRYNDLVLRIGPKRWLTVLSVSESEVPAFRQRAKKALSEAGRNRLGDPFPVIDFQFLGTWRVAGSEEIMAKLREIVHTEEGVYA